MDKPFRLQRSLLAVPATSPRFFAKAAASSVDAIFLDLEDAVAPSRKDAARDAAVQALNEVDWGDKIMSVRVNALDTQWALRDIETVVLNCPRLDLILLPKASSAFDIRFVDQVLTLLERERRLEKRIGVEALIETALGMTNVEEIARASDRLESLIFGIGDYSVEMRTMDTVVGSPSPHYAVLTGTPEDGTRAEHWNDQWHYALARIANACRAHGLRPIDGPFTRYTDPAGLTSSARRAGSLGFEGKMAIHPSQIEPINAVFSPTADQIAWARKVGDAMDHGTAAGDGALGVDGTLVDMAHLKLVQAILRRQEAIEGRQSK